MEIVCMFIDNEMIVYLNLANLNGDIKNGFLFLTLSCRVEKYKTVCLSFCLPAVHVLAHVNIFGLPCNSCMLLRFTMTCSVLKTKCVAVIKLLEAHSKETLLY